MILDHASSIGLGTGRLPLTNEPAVVRRNADVIRTAINGGIRLIDCASNYAAGTSEMVVGWVLAEMMGAGSLDRSDITVCSKGGYGTDSAAHNLAPDYLSEELQRSLEHLQLDYLDVYFLHNPEDALVGMNRAAFDDVMLRAFEVMENAVANGSIRAYGIATAEGLRIPGPAFHNLEDIVWLAERIGGRDHNMRVIQLPFSIGQPEAFVAEIHSVEGSRMSALAAVRALDLKVIASAALNRMSLPPNALQILVGDDRYGRSEAQLALNFVRSFAGVDCALFGTSDPKHAEEIAKLLANAPQPAAT